MKITDLKYWVVEGDAWNWTFLKLYTDEGLSGVGEATVEYNALTSAAALDEAREFIIHRNPFHIESFLQEICSVFPISKSRRWCARRAHARRPGART